jgi:hypothetical protein
MELRFVPEGMDGVVAIRPAALLRHVGLERVARVVSDAVSAGVFGPTLRRESNAAAPAHLKLGFEDIESVVTGVRFGREGNDKEPLRGIILGGVLTVRTRAPFDWLTYLRQYGGGCEEFREGGRVFYKLTSYLQHLGPDGCLYFHDDRTVVFGALATVRAMAARQGQAAPSYLRGVAWERASRGLMTVAIDNHDGRFPGRYDVGRQDDALLLTLFSGADHWIVGADDADPIVLNATAICNDQAASEAIVRAIETLRSLGQNALKQLKANPDDDDDPEAVLIGMAEALLKNLDAKAVDRSVVVRASGFGTLADAAAAVAGEQKAQADSARASKTPAQ